MDVYRRAFPRVAAHVAQRSGTLDEAKDVFHDAVLLYCERTAGGDFHPDDPVAYIFGTARHLWLHRHREATRYRPLDDEDDALADGALPAPVADRLLRFLHVAGHRCMEVLRAFYYDRLTTDALADRFGYAGPRSAAVQKYKCLEKVRETARRRALQYEDFTD